MRVLRPLVLSLLLVLGGGITALSAQNREVSGKVLDANQQPLVGVAVLVDGTTKGVTTSENGTFKIQVPSGEAVLQVTCLGYLPQKVTVPSSRNSITIYLQEDAIMLDATVVIGYGTQKKVNLTGAVATVGSKELENRVTHSLGSMLQGSVAGLNITTSSGKPGSTPAINIRGVNSINSADPLVLIDGVVGDLNRVNPNDVESISVIKDASAAAVYGARAAFGVILVTTKNGSAQDGKATVRYSGRFGWEEATTSTDYENRGYWSVYTVNKFWQADSGTNYVKYNDHDMQQLLARVNDVRGSSKRSATAANSGSTTATTTGGTCSSSSVGPCSSTTSRSAAARRTSNTSSRAPMTARKVFSAHIPTCITNTTCVRNSIFGSTGGQRSRTTRRSSRRITSLWETAA